MKLKSKEKTVYIITVKGWWKKKKIKIKFKSKKYIKWKRME
jgi:hypothetical protein